jgi:acyl-CoA reductase-like NAD-dependent aldehyde dehydrogenase
VLEACAALEARTEEIARDITRQMGKPLGQARGEVAGMAGRLRHMASIASEALADIVLPPKDKFERRIAKEPLGVVLDLPAWNYPLLTAVNAIAPAVLAGNAVVVKHSPRTPLCGEHFARAFAEAGAPEGTVQSVFLDYAGTEKLVGALYNAGQSCCAVERVYVHQSLYDRFVQAVEPLVRAYVMGDPEHEGTTLGPIAQPWHPEKLGALVKDATGRGARLITGGRAAQVNGKGRFFEATLLRDVPADAQLMAEEAFGPILPISPVSSDEEALAKMNASKLGLTASIWTTDRDRADSLARQLEFGTVYMNRCDALDPALPWSGVKDSGRGVTLSTLGFDALTRPKALHYRLRF